MNAAQPGLFDIQHAGPYQPSSDTSIAAAVAAAPKISPQKRAILRMMSRPRHRGMTQDEMSSWLDLPRSTVCARFNELERDGFICKNGDTRPTRYGRQAAVYVLTRPLAATGGLEEAAAGNRVQQG